MDNKILFQFQGEWVWVQPKVTEEFEIPYGAKVIRTDPGKVLVRDDGGSEEWIPVERVLRAMHVTSQQGVEDMITLGDLQEHAILRNLHLRYNERNIYVSGHRKSSDRPIIIVSMISLACHQNNLSTNKNLSWTFHFPGIYFKDNNIKLANMNGLTKICNKVFCTLPSRLTLAACWWP